MLDAVLATIGTLAVLASILAKLVWLRARAVTDDVTGPDGLDDIAPPTGAMRSARPCHRTHRRASPAGLRKQMPCVSTKTICSAGHSKR